MNERDRIVNDYFEWMSELVRGNRYSEQVSYSKLLTYLHSTPFRYSIPRDGNRAEDGKILRYRYAYERHKENAERYLDSPECSVLEMMIALAIRCEESIMDDPAFGDRTRQWFWDMIVNLGLGSMTNDNFDREYVEETVERFLNRDYEPNGKGGLFTIKNYDRDLRDVEIWHQMCWHLDEIM